MGKSSNSTSLRICLQPLKATVMCKEKASEDLPCLTRHVNRGRRRVQDKDRDEVLLRRHDSTPETRMRCEEKPLLTAQTRARQAKEIMTSLDDPDVNEEDGRRVGPLSEIKHQQRGMGKRTVTPAS